MQLPKLNGRNYNNWSAQLKVCFRSQDLWDLLEKGFVDVTKLEVFEALKKEEKEVLLETLRKDQKALYAIFQAEEEPIFLKILLVETSNAA